MIGAWIGIDIDDASDADRDRADRRDRRGRGGRAAHPGRRRPARRRSAPACRSARSIRWRTAPSRSACATGWRRRPRSTSAMSSSSTPSATAAATRGPTTPACTWSRSAISRSPACPTTPRRCARPAPASSRGTAFFRGRTGATAGPESSTRPSCRCSSSGRKTGKSEPARPLGRRERLRHCFGVGGSPWDEEKVLDRYELLYEAGLVEEARRDGREPRCRAQDSRRSARRCASTIAAFWRPRSRGCAPS